MEGILAAFIDDFSIDTLIAIIGCVLSALALFIGGTAYNNCRVNKISVKDKRVIHNDESDRSQHAQSITNNYGMDLETGKSLIDYVKNQMVSPHNGEMATMQKVYEQFELQTSRNLQTILDKVCQIVSDRKLELGTYDKLDWINIYFEAAKNSADAFMQTVWANVLATELSHPGTFSFKAIDILKNMDAKDFKLFEKLCSFEIDGCILQDKLTGDFGFNWTEMLRLKDFALMNLEMSRRSYTIPPNENLCVVYQDAYCILMDNSSSEERILSLDVYIISSFADELKILAQRQFNFDYVKAYAEHMRQVAGDMLKISLHKVNGYVNGKVNYDTTDLL